MSKTSARLAWDLCRRFEVYEAALKKISEMAENEGAIGAEAKEIAKKALEFKP